MLRVRQSAVVPPRLRHQRPVHSPDYPITAEKHAGPASPDMLTVMDWQCLGITSSLVEDGHLGNYRRSQSRDIRSLCSVLIAASEGRMTALARNNVRVA